MYVCMHACIQKVVLCVDGLSVVGMSLVGMLFLGWGVFL